MLAQVDVLLRPFPLRHIPIRVFEERVQLETDVSVVSLRGFPYRPEYLLSLADKQIGDLPGNVMVAKPFAKKLHKGLIESAGFDQVGDDDRVRRRARSSERPVANH